MASAKRLMALRQPCLNNSRMAEMSVPAWPMPIHQTKLMMANPQSTGCVMAQMPTPFRNSHVTAVSSTMATPPANVKRANQPIGVCGVSTMRAIFSVIDRKVWPCAITRNSPVAGSIMGSVGFYFLGCHGRFNPLPARYSVGVTSSSWFTLSTSARYCVRGRVF